MTERIGMRVHFLSDAGNVISADHADYWGATFEREDDGSLTIVASFETLAVFAKGVWKYVERLEGDEPDVKEIS